METENVKGGNILIAKFMGLPLFEYEYQHGESFQVKRTFDYHENWNSIMEVIEKIERSGFDDYEFNFNITGYGIYVSKFDDGSGIICDRKNEWGKSKLFATWECAVEFVKFYNDNNPKSRV